MAELKCKDGTVVPISDETEAVLRKAFGEKKRPIVTVGKYNKTDDYNRILINLPECFLPENYKGTVLVFNADGDFQNSLRTHKKLNGIYFDEKEVL